jgi:DNA-binding XRE family transcriptional regulator
MCCNRYKRQSKTLLHTDQYRTDRRHSLSCSPRRRHPLPPPGARPTAPSVSFPKSSPCSFSFCAYGSALVIFVPQTGFVRQRPRGVPASKHITYPYQGKLPIRFIFYNYNTFQVFVKPKNFIQNLKINTIDMMTSLKHLLASNMKAYRAHLGLSQAKLDERVGTATNYIAMIEGAKKFPSAEMLERIAGALERDAPELFAVPNPYQWQRQILSDIDALITRRLESLTDG